MKLEIVGPQNLSFLGLVSPSGSLGQSECVGGSQGMGALLVEREGCGRRALARALTLRAVSSGVGVCVADAETELPMAIALRAEAAALSAPVARPRRGRRGRRALGAVAPALEVESELSSLSPRTVLGGSLVNGGRRTSARCSLAAEHTDAWQPSVDAGALEHVEARVASLTQVGTSR